MRQSNNVPRRTLTEKEACQYLGVSRSFLAQARMEGNRKNRTPGPPFLKLGRAVRYRIDDLDTWLEKNLIAE